jgi:hypothetical protein
VLLDVDASANGASCASSVDAAFQVLQRCTEVSEVGKNPLGELEPEDLFREFKKRAKMRGAALDSKVLRLFVRQLFAPGPMACRRRTLLAALLLCQPITNTIAQAMC